jgi:hypothetical protein
MTELTCADVCTFSFQKGKKESVFGKKLNFTLGLFFILLQINLQGGVVTGDAL